jgi:transposase
MDETALRLLPPLRAAWAPKGRQATVPISGRNAQSSLYCALNLQSGRRITLDRPRQRQEDFQAFLRQLRHGGGAHGALLLLLDNHSSHTARASIKLAQDLGITLLWLPIQCPSLNPVDHLWRGLKASISANRQFSTIDEQVRFAEMWIHRLGSKEALLKSGLLSKKFWLHSVCKNFRKPT